MLVPLSSICVERPAGGLPPVTDWHTVFTSIVFSGLELSREPLDVAASTHLVGNTASHGCLHIIKGFTRLSCLLLVVVAAIELDLSHSDVWDVLLPLRPVLDAAWMLPVVATGRTKLLQPPQWPPLISLASLCSLSGRCCGGNRFSESTCILSVVSVAAALAASTYQLSLAGPLHR